jgi:branched-chain amino acid aminotransferase
MTVALATNVRRNDPRTLPPHLKTGNYLNNLLALREARVAGAEEVLMVNLEGWLTEGSVRNFWFVDGETAFTPPATDGLLIGVTRRILFEHVGPAAGIKLVEQRLRPEDLARFLECFASSTTQDIAPVAAIGAQHFHLGRQTLTRRLKEAFHAYVQSYCAAHPEFSVG